MPFKRATKRKRRNKRKVTLPRKVRALSKRVAQLTKDVDNLDGEFTYRTISYGTQPIDASSGANLAVSHNSQGVIEVPLSLLKYYDIKIPATGLLADFDAGSYYKDIQIMNSKTTLMIRTNYLVPVVYKAYVFRVKADTSLEPKAIMTSNVGDFSNVDEFSPLVSPFDFELLQQLYHIKQVGSGLLEPGKEKKIVISNRKTFDYSPAAADSHGLGQQILYGSGSLMFRLWGPVGHDVLDTGLQGRIESCVDFELFREIKIKYNAGANIKSMTGVDASNTTGTDITCNIREAAQQASTLS